MRKEFEILMLQISLLVAFAIVIGGSAMTLSSIRSSMNISYAATYQTTTHGLTSLSALGNWLVPWAMIIMVVWIILLMVTMRRAVSRR